MPPPPPPSGYDNRPFPTSLSSVPLAPRRKLRDGKDSMKTSGRSMDRYGEGTAGASSSSREGSSGSTRLGEGSSSRHTTPLVAEQATGTAAMPSSSASGANPSATIINAHTNVSDATSLSRPSTGNMEFMRGLGWEVRDIEPPNYANPLVARGLDMPGEDEDGQGFREGIIADAGAADTDSTYTYNQGHSGLASGGRNTVTEITNPDTYGSEHDDVDSLFDGEPDIEIETDPWDANHPHDPRPLPRTALAVNASNRPTASEARIGRTSYRQRSPSPAGSPSAGAGDRAGTRSPSPMMPLPMHISARNAGGGLGRVELEERERLGDAEGEGDEYAVDDDGALESAGSAAHDNSASNPASGENERDIAAGLALGSAIPSASQAPIAGSRLLDRLDAWRGGTARPFVPDDASLPMHVTDTSSPIARPSSAPAPAPASTSRNSSSDSIIMLDAPPFHATHRSTTATRRPANRADGQDGERDTDEGSRSSSQFAASDGGNSDGTASGERRYTREEKGKGRAEPLVRSAAADAEAESRTADRQRRADDLEQVEQGSNAPAGEDATDDVDMEGDTDIVYTGMGHAAPRYRMASSGIKRRRQQRDPNEDSDALTDLDSPPASHNPAGGEGEVGNDSIQWIEPPSKRARHMVDGGDDGIEQMEVKDEQDSEDEGIMRAGKGQRVVDWEDEERRRAEDGLTGINTHTCPICWNELSEPVMTPCGHIYCYPCFIQGLMNAIATNPNPFPGQPIPATQTGRGRNGQAITAHRTATQRGAGAAAATARGRGRGRGGLNGRGDKRAGAAAALLLDPTVPTPESFEAQPARWTAPSLARAIREHQLHKELKGYKDHGMAANDAQAVVDAMHADDAEIPEDTAANRQEVPGVKEVLRGLWEVKIPRPRTIGQSAAASASAGAGAGAEGEKEWVIEGECNVCRTALPGGMGPWDSGIGGVLPLSARLIDRNEKGGRGSKVYKRGAKQEV